jgi:hypothetical protein
MVVAGLATAVVWAVYLAIDPRLRFTPRPASVGGLLPTITDRLPLPAPYRAGVRFVLYYDQSGRRRSYSVGATGVATSPSIRRCWRSRIQ